MNRHERRKAAALHKHVRLPRARQDGRPLYYDIAPNEKVGCFECETRGLHGMRFGQFEGFMADPANSPTGHGGDLMTLCKAHLPEDAVIYNPGTNLCRNKSGDNTWMEDNPDASSSEKIAAKAGITLPQR